VLELFGATAHFLPAALVVLVLVIWHALTRQKWQADGDALAGMVVESALATLPLIGLTALTRRLFGPMALWATEVARPGLAAEILSGIGAGIYEEFIFRLAAIALVLFIGVDLLRAPRRATAALAILFTSVVFSLYHFLGAGGFDWHGFVFRGVAGLYLALLYIGRGFGVAVGAHACYNCYSAIAF
jgi:membrane protease YdiL (CAAX protease family)